MLPALVAGIGLVYYTGKSVDSMRYWNDYYKNTGHRPKYPFRGGFYGMGDARSAFGNLKKL